MNKLKDKAPKRNDQGCKGKPLSLYPLEPEDALKAFLSHPPIPKKGRGKNAPQGKQ